MSFSFLLSLTAKLMPVSTECVAALPSFRYPSYYTMLNKLELKILKRAFSISGALIWNSIPPSIKTRKKIYSKAE